jgi:hypothetical protein
MTTTNPLFAAALRAQAAHLEPHVILVYDLHGAPPSVYAKLDAELRKLQYSKVDEDTTWEARYQSGVDFDAALANTKAEFAACAGRAGAARYDLRVYGSPVPMKVVTDSKP